jgi:thiol-disulfide isomerase/thioredoxin
MNRLYVIISILAFALLTACTPTTNQPPTQATQQDSTPTSESLDSSAPAAAPAESDAAQDSANIPAWLSLPVTDARTGATFTLADFAGKTVWVEPMATWCTNCARQLPNVEAARIALDADQYVFVSFSVAENVDNATLAQYADEKGWNWTFAVATEALTQGMVDTFGRTVISPPSTPHFIINPDGSVSDIQTGTPGTDEIIAALQAVSGA